MNQQTIVFGGGCFWCTEAIFQRVKGVTSVEPGYAGGHTADPTYLEVCSGTTGHAEVVRVTFDAEQISLTVLLHIFFGTHNPTTLNQQGNDVGTSYRSIVLFSSPEQEAAVRQVIHELEDQHLFSSPIVTEVAPLTVFYPAEAKHAAYYNRKPDAPYCQVIIEPKLAAFRKSFAQWIRDEYADPDTKI